MNHCAFTLAQKLYRPCLPVAGDVCAACLGQIYSSVVVDHEAMQAYAEERRLSLPDAVIVNGGGGRRRELGTSVFADIPGSGLKSDPQVANHVLRSRLQRFGDEWRFAWLTSRSADIITGSAVLAASAVVAGVGAAMEAGSTAGVMFGLGLLGEVGGAPFPG